MDAHHHDHHALAGSATVPGRSAAVLVMVIAANAVLAAAQIVGGLAFGSLALLADSAHQVLDVLALATTLVALRLAGRAPTDRRTYGWQRVDFLAAQVGGVLLIASCAWVGVEAVHRIGQRPPVNGVGVIVLALIGLFVNGASAWELTRRAGESLSERGARLHLLGDAAGSALVLVAGIALVTVHARWVDPVTSLVLAVIVAIAGVRLVRDSSHLLLDGTPRGLDVHEVSTRIASMPGVVAVHHVHVWAMAAQAPALSAHVVLADGLTLHDAQGHGDEVRTMLRERFGIGHATLELECHPCADDDHGR
jgi:cobalt-zinc-cadmium efflux system protein